MKDNTIKAAVIIGAAILVSACVVYTGLSHVGGCILSAGQDVGLQISNKNHLRVDVSPVEIANPKKD